MEKEHKRWRLIDLIHRLQELHDEYDMNDDIAVIVNSDFDDYLYDISDVKIDTYYSKDKQIPFVSIDLYDNIHPIDLSKEDIED